MPIGSAPWFVGLRFISASWTSGFLHGRLLDRCSYPNIGKPIGDAHNSEPLWHLGNPSWDPTRLQCDIPRLQCDVPSSQGREHGNTSSSPRASDISIPEFTFLCDSYRA